MTGEILVALFEGSLGSYEFSVDMAQGYEVSESL